MDHVKFIVDDANVTYLIICIEKFLRNLFPVTQEKSEYTWLELNLRVYGLRFGSESTI